MKRVLATILVLVCVMSALAGCGEKTVYIMPDGSVNVDLLQKGITNERLKKMIERGEIPADTTYLNLAINQISDLTPLVLLTNLTSLNLGANEISDITPLKSLANLTELNLTGNEISDIVPLASLTNLTDLRLFSNEIPQEQIDELQKTLPDCEMILE